ncbi:MAG: alanine--tRNA ligase [Chloroflexi bacterium]|nr:alanine--tRNA ligase [Chloroflexota bacterium]MCC6893541.1 alanine--tRNA ligase [Anaerolineae bacterium]
MKPMSSSEARQAFLDFFEEHHHKAVASSSLVPGNDPTLLFTNAGMVQFKDVFLGMDKRDYKRATTSQKCMRVSGKHSDLENVGPSPRHHTFFEMLGNFSFGDYFKQDAIKFAYTLLTEVYGLPKERLAFTVYQSDDEAYNIWVKDMGVDPKRVARLGAKTNFWQMAETGPCGPTSELHWDKYPELGEDGIIQSLVDEDDRFLELWNLVFMQFNRTQDDPENTGKYDVPLPKPGVDTGMGLERILSVVNGVTNNYDTDLFLPIFKATQALTGDTDEQRDANIVPYRVIADHIRAAVFLISDGVLPGAKGRDAVCRLVIRRAARFGSKLGFTEPFLGTVANAVIEVMGEHYTDLVERAENIKKVITQEEIRFRKTLDRGLGELEAELDTLAQSGNTVLAGDKAFYLKATMGLPIQVIKDVAEERGFSVDEAAFNAAEEQHSTVSGGGQAMGEIDASEAYKATLEQLKASKQLGDKGVAYNPYSDTTVDDKVLAIFREGKPVDSAIAGEKVEIVLGKTGFYVESGGQVSDTGTISSNGWTVEVEDTKRPIGGLIVHVGEVVEGQPKVGDAAQAAVDTERRSSITRNHTGTHLLHAALRDRLGTHVQQRGSLVAPDRLRFDFVHDQKVSAEDIAAIEQQVNAVILANYPVVAVEKSLTEAKADGAMALFGEKYGDTVRTITIAKDGDRYSYELCGGVHVPETAEIGSFIIVSEGSVSAGIRRVEALTGRGAVEYVQHTLNTLGTIAQQLGTTPEQAGTRVHALQNELAAVKKQVGQLQRELAKGQFDQLTPETVNGIETVIGQFEHIPVDTLREMADWFRSKVKSGVLVVGSVVDNKPQLLAVVTDDLTKKGLHAGNLIKEAAAVVGGGGGGRPNMAQAGGKDASKLPDALNKARELIAQNTKG